MEVKSSPLSLLVVDVQTDFCPGGALEVREGDRVIPGLNSVIEAFTAHGLPAFFTRDWHPPDHVSFRAQGGPWPPHCVAGTKGAEFHPDLNVPSGAVIVSKGTSSEKEAYSGFQGTDLEERLLHARTEEVVLGGLATDYCVRATALDALSAGFGVSVLEDCVKAVDAKAGDGARALEELRRGGAVITDSHSVIRSVAGTQQWSHHPGLGQS